MYLRKLQLSRNTSLHVTNTVRNKRLPICTIENYLKNFIPIPVPGYGDFAGIAENCHKVLVVGDSHVKRIRKNDFNKELKKTEKLFFDLLAVQTIGSLYPTSIIHVSTNDILHNANHEDIQKQSFACVLNRCS